MRTKKELHLIISNKIKERKQKVEFIAENNLSLALKNETFKNAYYTIKDLEIQLSKADKNSDDEQQITSKIKEQEKIMQTQLAKNNLTLQSVSPQFFCKKCDDTGYDNESTCNCYYKLKNQLYLKESGVNENKLPNFSDTDFSKYKTNRKEIESLFNTAKSYINNSDKLNFILIGKTGVGKTYLSYCILNDSINKGNFSIFTSAQDLNKEFLRCHTTNDNNNNQILEPYETCDLLIIDDLGTENQYKNVTHEYLYRILDGRTRKKLKTVVNSNYLAEQIQDKYQDRIFSRLFNKQVGLIYTMPGNDLRLNI